MHCREITSMVSQKNRGVRAITGHRRDEQVLMGPEIHCDTQLSPLCPLLA